MLLHDASKLVFDEVSIQKNLNILDVVSHQNNFVLDVLNLFFSQIIFQITKLVVTGIRCEQFDHKNEVIQF